MMMMMRPSLCFLVLTPGILNPIPVLFISCLQFIASRRCAARLGSTSLSRQPLSSLNFVIFLLDLIRLVSTLVQSSIYTSILAAAEFAEQISDHPKRNRFSHEVVKPARDRLVTIAS